MWKTFFGETLEYLFLLCRGDIQQKFGKPGNNIIVILCPQIFEEITESMILIEK